MAERSFSVMNADAKQKSTKWCDFGLTTHSTVVLMEICGDNLPF